MGKRGGRPLCIWLAGELLCKEVDRKYTGCNLKLSWTVLLFKGLCAVNRLNTVNPKIFFLDGWRD